MGFVLFVARRAGISVKKEVPMNFLIDPQEGSSTLRSADVLVFGWVPPHDFPILLEDEVCPVCRKVCLDNFGEHATYCRELPDFEYRHDLIRDVFFYIFRRAGISVKKEAPMNFLIDPQEGSSTLRSADVLVFGWVGGKHAFVDSTGVFPLCGTRVGDFTVERAALKAASSKMTKREKACSDNQHVFIPFTFDTFDFLAPDVVDLLKRVQRVMHNKVVLPRSMDVVFQRLSFVIDKGLTAQLVVRLVFIHV
ncbi:auxilin-like protein [Trifolium medium]|uniref:Auxilin-like protein n=1 Tax=Trifolium medium TaxID=97028 RepID=A0A392MIJ9_9FABA|nr:auxilin-like protein [Trifolium medium]